MYREIGKRLGMSANRAMQVMKKEAAAQGLDVQALGANDGRHPRYRYGEKVYRLRGEGLTFQEIADMLDCPLSTVKTRLYQGLTVLRRQLERSNVTRLKDHHV